MGNAIKTAEQLYFNKDHDMVRRAVRDFVHKEINPHVDEWEEAGIAPLKKLFKKMGKLGFLGIRYDPKYGGQGLDYWYETVFLEELGHIKALGLAVAITVQTNCFLIRRQVLQHRLADWVTEIESLKQFIYHMVRMKQAGLDATREISMGKLMAGQLLNKVADGCLQMHGGMGYMKESIISRYYRDARGLSIGGGADEVLRGVIAKIENFA